jgi:hypothetical protein
VKITDKLTLMILATLTLNDYTNNISQLKESHKPERKDFYGKPHEKFNYTRRATRPWDNCWFSNKLDVISLTVEQACIAHPSYMKWIYKNLTYINWSVYSIRILEKL